MVWCPLRTWWRPSHQTRSWSQSCTATMRWEGRGGVCGCVGGGGAVQGLCGEGGCRGGQAGREGMGGAVYHRATAEAERWQDCAEMSSEGCGSWDTQLLLYHTCSTRPIPVATCTTSSSVTYYITSSPFSTHTLTYLHIHESTALLLLSSPVPPADVTLCPTHCDPPSLPSVLRSAPSSPLPPSPRPSRQQHPMSW